MIILQRKWVCLIVILLTHKWGELDQSTHRSYLSEQAFFKELAPGPSSFKQPAKTVNPPASNFLARLWPNPLSQPERKHKKTVRARWGKGGRGESFAFQKPEALHVFEMQSATSPHPTPPPSPLWALKISMLNKNIFQCMGKIFFVEFQRVPLKSTQNILPIYMMWILFTGEYLRALRFKSS